MFQVTLILFVWNTVHACVYCYKCYYELLIVHTHTCMNLGTCLSSLIVNLQTILSVVYSYEENLVFMCMHVHAKTLLKFLGNLCNASSKNGHHLGTPSPATL